MRFLSIGIKAVEGARRCLRGLGRVFMMGA